MSDHPWYRWYPGDYLADTRHLDAQQHGAYCLLLMAYYARERPLPDDDTVLWRLSCSASAQQWLSMRSAIAEFFQIGSGLWRHKRADLEIKRRKEEVNARKRGAYGSHASRAEHSAEHSAEHLIQIPDPLLIPKKEPDKDLPLQNSKKQNSSEGSVSACANRRKACPHDEIIALYHEVLPMLPHVRIWNEKRRRLLCQRWKEESDRQDLVWWRGYFEHVSACDFLTGKKEGRSGPFVANLEWLCKPSNLIKVYEGNYD